MRRGALEHPEQAKALALIAALDVYQAATRSGDESSARLPPALERELLDALDEADQEEGGAGAEFLESLRRFG